MLSDSHISSFFSSRRKKNVHKTEQLQCRHHSRRTGVQLLDQLHLLKLPFVYQSVGSPCWEQWCLNGPDEKPTLFPFNMWNIHNLQVWMNNKRNQRTSKPTSLSSTSVYLHVIWSRNCIMCLTQHPQLVRGHVALCSYWMIIPTTAESIQVILQVWQEYIVAAEEVFNIWNAEKALPFKVVENVIIDVCYSNSQVSPQPLNPGELWNHQFMKWSKHALEYLLLNVIAKKSFLLF